MEGVFLNMFNGSIEYLAEMKGHRFDPIDLLPPPDSKNITKVEIKCEDPDKIKIIFNVVEVESWEQVDSMTFDLVNNYLDLISFHFGVCIENPTVTGGTLKREIISEDGSVSANIMPRTGSVVAKGYVGSVVTFKIKDKEKLTNILKSEVTSEKKRYIRSFRTTLQNSDPVVRYMSLYKILFEIFNDKQEQVNYFIRKIDPNIIQTPRPDKPHIMETIYTRLRNEMSHTRSNVNDLNTKNEIKQNVSGLVNIVKEAIQQFT